MALGAFRKKSEKNRHSESPPPLPLFSPLRKHDPNDMSRSKGWPVRILTPNRLRKLLGAWRGAGVVVVGGGRGGAKGECCGRAAGGFPGGMNGGWGGRLSRLEPATPLGQVPGEWFPVTGAQSRFLPQAVRQAPEVLTPSTGYSSEVPGKPSCPLSRPVNEGEWDSHRSRCTQRQQVTSAEGESHSESRESHGSRCTPRPPAPSERCEGEWPYGEGGTPKGPIRAAEQEGRPGETGGRPSPVTLCGGGGVPPSLPAPAAA